jgi:lysophospholipase L1-like esterase
VNRRWLAVVPAVIALRALRVRFSVAPRRRYWQERSTEGDLLLVALGDSLTQGIGSSSAGTSWLGRYVEHVQATTGRPVRVMNRARYGARVADLIAEQLPVPPEADLVVVCIGANDAGRTHPEEFRARLREVGAALPAGSVVGDVPEFQWGPRVIPAAQLAEIVREVVAEFPALRLALVEKETTGISLVKDLAGDFFHPSNSGYDHIARAFVNAGLPERLLPADPREQTA